MRLELLVILYRGIEGKNKPNIKDSDTIVVRFIFSQGCDFFADFLVDLWWLGQLGVWDAVAF